MTRFEKFILWALDRPRLITQIATWVSTTGAAVIACVKDIEIRIPLIILWTICVLILGGFAAFIYAYSDES